MINDVLDNRYEILERVGGGGMADVYRAHDKLLDRYVAVKILHAQFSNDDEFIVKFRREAQGAAKLSHPNIVNIYDVGKELNRHYIIMEYVSGETLKDKIQREGALPVEESLRIVREIAEALEHAHQNNLVHCDIKPHNILIAKSGRLKVTDFGIARAVTSTTMTYSGTIIGSVHYFSPEQAKGGIISTKSDIYSLGVVLYELLTGTVPFTGETPVSIALKHLQDEPDSVKKRNQQVPAIVEAIVLKSMAKNPEDRFPNIRVMIADLKAAENCLLDQQTRKINKDEFSTQVLPPITDIAEMNQEVRSRVKNTSAVGTLKSKKLLLGLIILLAVGFLIGAFFFYGKIWSNNEVTVPNVVGKQAAVAKQSLEAEGLRINMAEAFDETVPVGHVVSQYPEAGAIVKEQRLITIYISKGGEAVNAPDLKGLSRRDAEIQLKNLGLRIGRVDEQFSDQPFDTVMNQNPRQGTQVTKGYAIDVTISKGAESRKLVLPDFRGSSFSTIKTQLESLKLKLGKITEVDDNKNAPETIVAQNPDSGAEVLEGTAIDFSVTKTGNSTSKHTSVELTIPEGSAKQAVQIVLTDINGRRVVYESVHKAGDKISKSIEGNGDLRVQIYLNGKIIQEKNI